MSESADKPYRAVGDHTYIDHFAIVNGRLVLPDRIVDDQALVIEDGRIALCTSNPPEFSSRRCQRRK